MKKILLILLLALPSIALMFNTGIYTMHDFHLFRQFEFNQCISEGVFPCRWSANSGMGYGEPVFNFYGQFPYWIGQLIIFAGFSIINSLKVVFALSLLLSGISMYFLAKRFWGPLGSVISAIFYIYAPYRAVDVWVRGALPEALSFVFFPSILLFIETKKYKMLCLALALLLITHNLSFFMFLPFMGIWWLVRSRDVKIFPVGLFSLLLASFYLVPVLLENHLVTLAKTTTDYYSYALHYVTLFQLFISNTWGYGGSTWGPNDTMSFSLGTLHWALPFILLALLLIGWLFRAHKHINISSAWVFSLSLLLGVFAAFLTHGKAEFIWKLVPGFSFVQFPWRFLTMSTLFLSLSSGFAVKIFPKNINILLLVAVIVLNFNYFRPDIWKTISDTQAFSGSFWNEQRSSALSDYWPVSSPSLPKNFAPNSPYVEFGSATVFSSNKLSHSANYRIDVDSDYAKVTFPIVYFPGWVIKANNNVVKITPTGELGLISTRIPKGNQIVTLKFTDTLPRVLGNGLSVVGLIGLFFWKQKYA